MHYVHSMKENIKKFLVVEEYNECKKLLLSVFSLQTYKYNIFILIKAMKFSFPVNKPIQCIIST